MVNIAPSGRKKECTIGFSLSVPVQYVSLKERNWIPRICSTQIAVDTPRKVLTELHASSGKPKPDWTGDTPLSRLVNALVTTPLVRSAVRVAARQVAISIAEKNGISWRQRVAESESLIPFSKRDDIISSIQDPDVTYPEYYLKPFHAYKDGNLGWLQAFEVVPSTKYVCLRTVQTENQAVDPVGAYDQMYSSFFKALENAAPSDWLNRSAFEALDVGCSVGLSTRDVARRLLASGVDVSHVEGIDLSPYFLAVALADSSPLGSDHTNVDHIVSFRQAKAEQTKLEDSALDLITIQFLVHELPAHVTRAVVKEAFRVLKPNSVLGIYDMDPSSSIIQNLTPALFTFSKSTEPFIDQYFNLNFVELLKETGFINVKCVKTDPRNRAIVATRP